MKLKYYLRGMGIGIILTAIVMGFALGGRKATLSDAEIIQRAKALGMVDASNGVLSQTAEEANKENENDPSASGPSLDEKRAEISQEVQPEVAETATPVSKVDEAQEQGENAQAEALSSKTESDAASSENKTAATDDTGNKSLEASTEKTAVEAADTNTTVEDTTKEDAEDDASAHKSDKTTSQSEVAASDNSEAKNTGKTSAAAEASTAPEVPSKSITIPGGMGSDQVAVLLYQQGIVDNATTFNRYLIDRGQDRYIRSGVKTIPIGSSYEEIASIITKG